MKCLAFAAGLLASPVLADAPVIKGVDVTRSGDSWRFAVTLAHPDTGWDHYADGWRVETTDGTVLGTRVLAHPHVDEQPFTRSLGGVGIADGITTVVIRSRCIVDGWSETGTTVVLNP